MPVSSRRLALAVAAALLTPPGLASQVPTVTVELEGGPVWQGYNDVEVPNDGSATRFSLASLAGSGPWAAARLYVTWNVGERHGLRALVAPLSLTETGVPDGPIRFAGATYEAGRPTDATYTFNSYRLSYRYRAWQGSRTAGWVGFTAKVRDAVIALEQGDTSSREENVGFVPLLHLSGEWRLAPDLGLSADVDGLAGGPGRAIDAALKLGWTLGERWSLRVGYRTLEGGADVADVYAFAWLHYAAISVAWSR